MTTSSSVSDSLPSQNITNSEEPGVQISWPEANISKVGDCGLEVEFSKTVQQSSSTKTVTFPAKIFLSDQHTHQRTPYTPYSFDNINFFSHQLRIPWELSKDMPFTSTTTYIGFDWNIETYQVYLDSKKKEKYLRATEEWLLCQMHTLKEV